MCSSLKIRIFHGRPSHPQSQGQVERLNKKIRRILRYRLLDFSPEEQSTVWPFLLPEITFILNSWHSALCATPFEVFFGRSSCHCSIADRGAVAVWPSDEFMAFMKDSSSKCESRTDIFEKSIYSMDLWGFGNTDSETDSESGDMALQRTVNCHPIQSDNIAEIQRSLLQLHTERRIIELKAIEVTERKYYENYLCMPRRARTKNLSVEMKYGFITLKSRAWL